MVLSIVILVVSLVLILGIENKFRFQAATIKTRR